MSGENSKTPIPLSELIEEFSTIEGLTVEEFMKSKQIFGDYGGKITCLIFIAIIIRANGKNSINILEMLSYFDDKEFVFDIIHMIQTEGKFNDPCNLSKFARGVNEQFISKIFNGIKHNNHYTRQASEHPSRDSMNTLFNSQVIYHNFSGNNNPIPYINLIEKISNTELKQYMPHRGVIESVAHQIGSNILFNRIFDENSGITLRIFLKLIDLFAVTQQKTKNAQQNAVDIGRLSITFDFDTTHAHTKLTVFRELCEHLGELYHNYTNIHLTPSVLKSGEVTLVENTPENENAITVHLIKAKGVLHNISWLLEIASSVNGYTMLRSLFKTIVKCFIEKAANRKDFVFTKDFTLSEKELDNFSKSTLEFFDAYMRSLYAMEFKPEDSDKELDNFCFLISLALSDVVDFCTALDKMFLNYFEHLVDVDTYSLYTNKDNKDIHYPSKKLSFAKMDTETELNPFYIIYKIQNKIRFLYDCDKTIEIVQKICNYMFSSVPTSIEFIKREPYYSSSLVEYRLKWLNYDLMLSCAMNTPFVNVPTINNSRSYKSPLLTVVPNSSEAFNPKNLDEFLFNMYVKMDHECYSKSLWKFVNLSWVLFNPLYNHEVNTLYFDYRGVKEGVGTPTKYFVRPLLVSSLLDRIEYKELATHTHTENNFTIIAPVIKSDFMGRFYSDFVLCSRRHQLYKSSGRESFTIREQNAVIDLDVSTVKNVVETALISIKKFFKSGMVTSETEALRLSLDIVFHITQENCDAKTARKLVDAMLELICRIGVQISALNIFPKHLQQNYTQQKQQCQAITELLDLMFCAIIRLKYLLEHEDHIKKYTLGSIEELSNELLCQLPMVESCYTIKYNAIGALTTEDREYVFPKALGAKWLIDSIMDKLPDYLAKNLVSGYKNAAEKFRNSGVKVHLNGCIKYAPAKAEEMPTAKEPFFADSSIRSIENFRPVNQKNNYTGVDRLELALEYHTNPTFEGALQYKYAEFLDNFVKFVGNQPTTSKKIRKIHFNFHETFCEFPNLDKAIQHNRAKAAASIVRELDNILETMDIVLDKHADIQAQYHRVCQSILAANFLIGNFRIIVDQIKYTKVQYTMESGNTTEILENVLGYISNKLKPKIKQLKNLKTIHRQAFGVAICHLQMCLEFGYNINDTTRKRTENTSGAVPDKFLGYMGVSKEIIKSRHNEEEEY